MSDERKMILTMLAEGKLSVDEAERLLVAVNEPAQQRQEDKAEEEVGPPTTFVDWDAWDDRKQAYRQKSSGFKITQYIENFIQKLKDVDLDFNFGSYETVKHIFQDNDADFSNLSIDIKNGAVVIVPWDEKAVQIDCEAKVYKVQSEEEAWRRFISETRFDIKEDTLIFACDVNDLKVNTTVYVPRKFYTNVAIKMFNGHVSGNEIFVNALKVKTVNGSLSFPKLQAVKVELETGNGTITVDGKVEQLELETINGAVNLKGAFCDVHVETFSGMVTAELMTSGLVSLRSTTGGLHTKVPADVQIHGELTTAVGSIHCDLSSFEVLKEKKEMTQRLLKFACNKKSASSLTLDANTKTGAITVTEPTER